MRPSWVLRTVEDGAVVRYRLTVCDHNDSPHEMHPTPVGLVYVQCTFCKTMWTILPMHSVQQVAQGIKVERMSDDEEE